MTTKLQSNPGQTCESDAQAKRESTSELISSRLQPSGQQKKQYDVVVIGGGVGGLCTALYLAMQGMSVQVVEKSKNLGGRAKTKCRHGFSFNLGAHALKCRGHAMKVLKELQVPVFGQSPATSGRLWIGGRSFQLPSSIGSICTTGALSMTSKIAMAGWMARLSKKPQESVLAEIRQMSTQDWLESEMRDDDLREVMGTFFRLVTYVGDLNLVNADVALREMYTVLSGGVLYLEGGWGRLVDELAQRCIQQGVEFQCGNGARVIERTEQGWCTSLADGSEIQSAFVVVAGSSETLQRLLWTKVTARTPARMACLDLALSKSPVSNPCSFALDADERLYYSEHSATAEVGPKGGMMIHTAKYLLPGEEDLDHRKTLEAWMDRVLPGWKQWVVAHQYLPKIVVMSELPGHKGSARSGIEHRLPKGLWRVGDGMCEHALLADGVLFSARKAAIEITRERQCLQKSGNLAGSLPVAAL